MAAEHRIDLQVAAEQNCGRTARLASTPIALIDCTT